MITFFGEWEGYESLPFAERYRLIRQAGFDATLVWWDEGDVGDFRTQPAYARAAGLFVENMHASFDYASDLWKDDLAGQTVFDYYMQCLQDCGTYEIPTMVMHTGCGDAPLPPVTPLALDRLRRMIDRAEQLGVNIAIENQCNPSRIERAMAVLEHFDSPRLGMCYDSGHGNVHHSLGLGKAMLARFGHRLKALHLHDNDGSDDQHLPPFEGNIDWPAVMRQIAETGYQGPTTMEGGGAAGYRGIPAEEYLASCFERLKKLEALRNA